MRGFGGVKINRRKSYYLCGFVARDFSVSQVNLLYITHKTPHNAE